jgi:hypothetical protein
VSHFAVGAETVEVVPTLGRAAVLQRVEQLSAQRGTTVECRSRYDGRMLGIEAAAAINQWHYLSAGGCR